MLYLFSWDAVLHVANGPSSSEALGFTFSINNGTEIQRWKPRQVRSLWIQLCTSFISNIFWFYNSLSGVDAGVECTRHWTQNLLVIIAFSRSSGTHPNFVLACLQPKKSKFFYWRLQIGLPSRFRRVLWKLFWLSSRQIFRAEPKKLHKHFS